MSMELPTGMCFTSTVSEILSYRNKVLVIICLQDSEAVFVLHGQWESRKVRVFFYLFASISVCSR